ncbi:TenA family transcriptional regulator [Mycolicibacterium moriokaense]|jgi:thiaminase/transcriptional activator TenA|uniref:Aminopyrimidine aminohydrolase n=1 Tax=Mycolicibacterium moriokaense TaxID=39691 RepID=A0AAD1H7X5_9MYCO|nr:TenA family protein [Mycolicibacterium moriokaense]MCV7037868.1 TenA family protein [Mycolicibacterium moriokaense]ORB19681.1 TenA family transcriptional regulator [Mycolicibacterium moriokaense]BBW99693.1 aminopyrimidine aminohydrolase [Mycolicibacterium moriokaense]
MSLSKRLWNDNRDVADDALAHPFVRGLGDGSLDRDVFAGYVAQDAFFLESFTRAYALALARSTDTPTLIALAGLIAGVADELKLHNSYAARWGIDMAGVEPSPATLAYTDFLLATAATSDLGVILAAMTPCMRLYAWLGASLDADKAGPYAEWVQTYADSGFDGLASQLEGLLDQHADDNAAVATAYRRAMHLEVQFFEAAFSG